MKTIKFIASVAILLILTACGIPERPALRNLTNATPVKVLELPAVTPGVQASAVPVTAVPVSNTAVPVSNTAAPTSSGGFVLIYELYGTPTQRSDARPTQPVPTKPVEVQPTAQPTQVAQVQPTQVPPTQPAQTNPTLPPTATKPVTAAPTAGSSGGGAVKGDPARGKSLFSSAGCAGCHDVATGGTLVGPSMKGVGTRAATRKPPMTASDYLHESIKTPNAFVVKGFTAGVMVQNYGQTLKDSQIDDLVAYLLSLK